MIKNKFYCGQKVWIIKTEYTNDNCECCGRSKPIRKISRLYAHQGRIVAMELFKMSEQKGKEALIYEIDSGSDFITIAQDIFKTKKEALAHLKKNVKKK